MLYLQDLAKQGLQTSVLTLKDRLPDFLTAPCVLNVSYQVEAIESYHIIHLEVSGNLNIICQRCMHEFTFHYENHTDIAVCRDDEQAELLLENYESIVSANGKVDLDDLVIDELHLYVPVFHPDISYCDNEINQFLTTKNETY